MELSLDCGLREACTRCDLPDTRFLVNPTAHNFTQRFGQSADRMKDSVVLFRSRQQLFRRWRIRRNIDHETVLFFRGKHQPTIDPVASATQLHQSAVDSDAGEPRCKRARLLEEREI